ncbi:hypothetical protein [Halorarius halobius]|uniref:hypothetical protein n=1 Tax=Halorarius halobius TaxID=2962671 RepID=UPI0020CC1543|nr:hypothetical protein [Halorarius halobius]
MTTAPVPEALFQPETAGGGFPVATVVFALGFAAVHLSAGRWEFVHPERRRLFLSAGGGASVAYVFVLVLPEMGEAALVVSEVRLDAFFAEQLVFLVALLGFTLFYGVEVFVSQRRGEAIETSRMVYRAHLLVFVAYSATIGYLLFHQERAGLTNLFFYSLAMGLHFAITDYGLHRHYGATFDTTGRVLLAAGTLVGATTGLLTALDPFSVAMLFGFLAGGIVFNVLKEELPDITESRFAAFAGGAFVFAVLLLLA